MMNVEQAMQQRHSVRALPRTVDAALVRDLLAQAGQAASGGNLQPWRVIALTGDSLQALRQAMPAATPTPIRPWSIRLSCGSPIAAAALTMARISIAP
jgi:nitroreductase